MHTFSSDLGTVFSAAIGAKTTVDTVDLPLHMVGEIPRKDLSAEQKEKRKLAKRIIKAVQASLEDVMRKESELCRKPFEKELRDLDLLLEASISSRRDSINESHAADGSDDEMEEHKPSTDGESRGALLLNLPPILAPTEGEVTNIPVGVSHPVTTNGDTHASMVEPLNSIPEPTAQKPALPPYSPTPSSSNPAFPTTSFIPAVTSVTSASKSFPAPLPPTPPLSSSSDLQTPLSNGGIPWYMKPFDPAGTTVQEERWTGREVARGMSEELSDMDEEELSGLVEGDATGLEMGKLGGDGVEMTGVVGEGEGKKKGKRKRWRGFK